MKKIFDQIIPFIGLGILLVLFLIGLVFLSYLLIYGAIIGVILFAVSWVRYRFFPQKQKKQNQQSNSGRIIEHNDRIK